MSHLPNIDEYWKEVLTENQSGHSHCPRRHKRSPEKKVQKQIVSWLLSKGVVLAVTDAGVLYGVYSGIPTGWGDITGCLPNGRFLMVECKALKGKQSPAQAKTQVRIESNRGLYILANSLEIVQEILGFLP